MGQGSFIAGCLVGGFVLFLAARGRLPTYGAVLWGNTQAAAPGGSGSSGGSGGIGGLLEKGAEAGIGAALGL